MRCPYCGSLDTQVKDSRPTDDSSSIRRRRVCPDCGGRFTTFERVQLRELTVVKKSGRRAPFDRDKLARSVQVALRKRPVDPERVDRMINGLVRQLESQGEPEIPSETIGELVMQGLKTLDEVAYVRFASVYRNFREARDFGPLLDEFSDERRGRERRKGEAGRLRWRFPARTSGFSAPLWRWAGAISARPRPIRPWARWSSRTGSWSGAAGPRPAGARMPSRRRSRRPAKLARGATLYVTLEPCAHHGQTPPCAEAVVAAGVARVVGGLTDPDRASPAQGFALLRAAGIEVETDVLPPIWPARPSRPYPARHRKPADGDAEDRADGGRSGGGRRT